MYESELNIEFNNDIVLTVTVVSVLVCLAIAFLCYDRQRRRKNKRAKTKLIQFIVMTAQRSAATELNMMEKGMNEE